MITERLPFVLKKTGILGRPSQSNSNLDQLKLNQAGWIDSDADLDSSPTKFQRKKMRVSVNFINDLYIWFGSVHSRYSRLSQAWRTAEPNQTQFAVSNWFIEFDSAHVKYSVWDER